MSGKKIKVKRKKTLPTYHSFFEHVTPITNVFGLIKTVKDFQLLKIMNFEDLYKDLQKIFKRSLPLFITIENKYNVAMDPWY